jgi:hypothetical protein
MWSGLCSANLVVSGASQSYVCASFHNGKACTNGLRVPRGLVESRMLGDLRARLLSDEALDRFKADVRELLRSRRKESTAAKSARVTRAAKLRGEVANLVDAIASVDTPAARRAVADRLDVKSQELAVEAELVVDEKAVSKVEEMVPRVAETFRRLDRQPAHGARRARRGGSGRDRRAWWAGRDSAGARCDWKGSGGRVQLGQERALVFACLGRRASRGADISNGSGGSLRDLLARCKKDAQTTRSLRTTTPQALLEPLLRATLEEPRDG